ncbi:MAG: hypothetical protein JW841_00655 [Deltaproteobacteria bacterium]|nr:hypothetical protein [Deltaproteobacteria bacterium]
MGVSRNTVKKYLSISDRPDASKQNQGARLYLI